MIYIKSFKNYDEFKQLFSVVKHGNGVVSRKNKILLACLKNRKLFHWWLGFKEQDAELTDNCDYLRATNMDDLKYFAKHMVSDIALHDPDSEDTLYILSFDKDFPYTLYSTTLSLDTLRGVCTDGDVKSIRYKDIERGRIFKMKAGKFITRCIEECRIPREYMPEQLKRWIGEEFARDWQVYAEQRVNNDYTLHVDDDFEAIYDGDRCLGDFGSCMTGKGHHTYYRDAIKAKAAYITDDDDMIVARCIVYIYEELYLTRGKASHTGQFFTPPSVADIMSRISSLNEKQSGIVNDCASGSGRLLLAHYMAKSSLNHSAGRRFRYIAQDVDPIACKMCALNLMAHGMNANVICQDTLTMSTPSVMYCINEVKYPFNTPYYSVRTVSPTRM